MLRGMKLLYRLELWLTMPCLTLLVLPGVLVSSAAAASTDRRTARYRNVGTRRMFAGGYAKRLMIAATFRYCFIFHNFERPYKISCPYIQHPRVLNTYCLCRLDSLGKENYFVPPEYSLRRLRVSVVCPLGNYFVFLNNDTGKPPEQSFYLYKNSTSHGLIHTVEWGLFARHALALLSYETQQMADVYLV